MIFDSFQPEPFLKVFGEKLAYLAPEVDSMKLIRVDDYICCLVVNKEVCYLLHHGTKYKINPDEPKVLERI